MYEIDGIIDVQKGFVKLDHYQSNYLHYVLNVVLAHYYWRYKHIRKCALVHLCCSCWTFLGNRDRIRLAIVTLNFLRFFQQTNALLIVLLDALM